jgi:putative dehydrogenase
MTGSTVGVLGLGIMGSAIARNLVAAGHQVVGYDPSAEQCAKAKSDGVDIVGSATIVADRSEKILSSLPSEGALNDTTTELVNERTHQAAPIILAELSTLGLACKKTNLDRLAAANITLLDCPLSGTGAQAATGDVVVYGSGDLASYEQCLPVFSGFSRASHHLGEFGNGTKAKLVANLLVAIHNIATAEALVLGERSGMDLNTLREVIESGAGTSRIFELRSPLMISGQYEPATMKLDVWQKDLQLITQFAEDCGVTTPLFSAGTALYEAAVAGGRGQQDTAAVCAVLQEMANSQTQSSGD